MPNVLEMLKGWLGVVVICLTIGGSIAGGVIVVMDRIEMISATNRETVKAVSDEGRRAVGDVVTSLNALNTTIIVQETNMSTIAKRLDNINNAIGDNDDKLVQQAISIERQSVTLAYIKEKVNRAHP